MLRLSFKRWLLAGLVLHLLAACFSVGIYDLDEHFQTLEFVAYRLGRADPAQLPWEFGLQQRPWIQPLLYEGIARVWLTLGVDRPLFWTASFRLFSALLGWLATVGLALCCRDWLKEERWRKIAVQGLSVLWFLPYFHARTSSESFSGSLFFLGVSVLTLGSGACFSAWSVGALWGLAAYSRYQIGPMLVGVTLWCVGVGRLRPKTLAWIGLGGVTAFVFGLLLDRWGYGFWTVSPWNHLERNVLRGLAAKEFGAQPWWFYFYFVYEYLPILSAPLGFMALLGGLFRPRHILAWSTLPMVLALSWIQHKELRFLFPVSTAAPVLAVFAVSTLAPTATRILPWKSFWKGIWLLLVIANAGALAVATLKPSSSHSLFYDYVYRQWPKLRELHYLGEDPYSLGGSHVQYDRHPGLQLTKDANWASLPREGEFYLFYEQFELPAEAGSLRSSCHLEYTVFPDVLRKLLFLPGLRNSACKWSVYRCQ